MRRLKIGNVIEESRFGGPQKRMALVSEHLKYEIDTKIISPMDTDGAFRDFCRNKQLDFIEVELITLRKNLYSIIMYGFFFLRDIYKLVTIFNDEKFDLIHVSGGCWQVKGVIAALICRIKVVWHLNDTYTPLIFRLILRYLSKYADGIIFASERSKTYYADYVSEKPMKCVIPAPIIVPPKLHKKRSVHEKKYVIGMVANIVPVKGISDFIKVVKCLNKLGLDCDFKIAGAISKNQTEYYNRCKRIIEQEKIKNISFLGHVSDVQGFLSTLDLYFCTSISESSPMSVWEAMAQSIPVVAMDVGDVPLYVGRYQFLIVNNRDIQCFALTAQRLLENERIRFSIGHDLSKDVRRNMSVKKIGLKHQQFYNSILERN